MSASELLKQVKKLPARERQKFIRAVLAMKKDGSAHPSPPLQRVNWPDVEARARLISGGRLLPNLVLLEREETAL